MQPHYYFFMEKRNFMLNSDLALEAKEMYEENAGEITEISGVKATVKKENDILITKVEILNERGERALGKPKGTYITIEFDDFHLKELAFCIKNQILSLVRQKSHLAVAGLGNVLITPDAIGPITVDNLIVTRHILEYNKGKFEDLFGWVSAIKTGVMSRTGIESSDIIKGFVKETGCDLLIAVDALKARETKRLAHAVQITDTGICPGSGVGNHRKEISRNTLSVPVIAIGVPMVVDSKTIVYDFLPEENKDSLFEKIKDDITPMIVAPKESDELVRKLGKTVAYAINLAFHNIEFDDLEGYID